MWQPLRTKAVMVLKIIYAQSSHPNSEAQVLRQIARSSTNLINITMWKSQTFLQNDVYSYTALSVALNFRSRDHITDDSKMLLMNKMTKMGKCLSELIKYGIFQARKGVWLVPSSLFCCRWIDE